MGKIKCVSQYYKPDSINFEKEKKENQRKTKFRNINHLYNCTAITVAIYDLSTRFCSVLWLLVGFYFGF